MQQEHPECIHANIYANAKTENDVIPKDRIPYTQLKVLADSVYGVNEPPRPRKPEHPILHTNHDERSFVSCIDLLKRSANFIELLGYIVVDDEDQRVGREGGLPPGAAWAYRQLVATVADSVRFATGALELNSDEVPSDSKSELKRAVQEDPPSH